MTASAMVRSAGIGARRAPGMPLLSPGLPMLWAIAVAGCAAAAGSVALALTSDHVAEPGLQAALMDWMALPYVIAGVIAWRRRPDSRFGPPMVVAGFVTFLATLAWSKLPAAFTIGQAMDLLPAVLFLHVFLAFPSGRLERRLERVIVAAGYFTAFGLQLVGLLLGGFGPDNLLAIASEPGVAETLLRVQLVGISALVLIGVGVLVARRRAARVARCVVRRSCWSIALRSDS
jgi:hypothetical protein